MKSPQHKKDIFEPKTPTSKPDIISPPPPPTPFNSHSIMAFRIPHVSTLRSKHTTYPVGFFINEEESEQS